MSRADLIRWLIFGLAYFSCAELGYYLSFADAPHFATFWPASGLFVGALARSAKKDWWGYVALAVLVNGFSELLRGTGVSMTAAFCVANTLEALLAAVLLHRVRHRPFQIEGLSDSLWFAGLGALLATLAGAAVGGAAVTAGHGTPLVQNLFVWWMADAAGVLAVAPILLTFEAPLVKKWALSPKVWLEAAAIAILVVGSSLIAFGPKLGFQRSLPAYPFVVAPFLIWCGLRFGNFGTSLGVFLASVVAVWGTTRGYGVFAFVESTLEMKAAALQVYVLVVTVTPLMFATAIHQQRTVEMGLRASEAKARAMFAMAADAIIWIDERGTIEAFNPSAEKMFGYAAEQIIGRNIKLLMPPPYSNEHDDYLANYLGTGQRKILGTTREVAGLRRDGSIFPLELMVSEVPLGDRRMFTGVVRDITERRLAQRVLEEGKAELERRVAERTAELVQANQRLRLEISERSRAEARLREQQNQLAHAARLSNLGQMAAELAHEVNQPLSVISNYVRGTQRRLQSENASLVEIEPTLAIIGKEANRAADVVRRIKSFVRKAVPIRTPLDAGAAVREAIALVELELRQRQIHSDLHLPHWLPKCAGDSVQLQQVIVNLLLNAADALETLPSGQRQVTVSVDQRDDFLEFAVADSGPGISPADTERIFDAFYSSKPEGLGLGLPISRGIIEGHGGKLWIERQQVVGACFRFTLPVWEEPDGDFVERNPNRLRRG